MTKAQVVTTASAVLRVAVVGLSATYVFAQTRPPATAPKVDRASAYYHYTLAHMYAEQAGMFGNRSDFVAKAIDNFKEAIKADPTSSVLTEELSDLYIQTNRLREAQSDAEEVLKQNPNDLNAHRLLARIFTRLIGDGRNGRIDENMLRRAIDQYRTISNLAPRDIDALLMLARLEKASNNSPEAEKAYQKVLSIEPDNEDAMTGLAVVYGDLGDTRRAAEILKALTDKNPSQRTLQALAATYEQMRDFKSAAGVYRRLLDTNPANPREIMRSMAQSLTFAREYDAALATYESMIADDPSDAQPHLRMSQIYRQQRNLAKARQSHDKAKALDPSSIEIRFNEVNLLEAEDKTADAAQALKDLLNSTAKRNYNQNERTSRAGLLERLAALYRSLDQTNAAVDAYRQAGELDSSFGARSAAQIIDALRTGREFTRAQQEADAALKKYPDDNMVRITRDSLLAELGRVDEAAADLRKMLNGKEDRDIYVSLANVYEKGRRFDDMAKALDEAEKLSDDQEEKENIWFMRGAMFEHQKKLEAAEAEFRKVLQSNPDSAGAMNYIGYMLADANLRLEESLDLINQALEREPGNGAYLDSLGWVQYRMGRWEEAERNLRVALQKTPRDPTVHDHMADVLMKQSKLREAVAQYERSLVEWDASSPADLRPDEIAQVKAKLEAARMRLALETSAR